MATRISQKKDHNSARKGPIMTLILHDPCHIVIILF